MLPAEAVGLTLRLRIVWSHHHHLLSGFLPPGSRKQALTRDASASDETENQVIWPDRSSLLFIVNGNTRFDCIRLEVVKSPARDAEQVKGPRSLSEHSIVTPTRPAPLW